MNRARLSQLVLTFAAVTVAGLTYTIYQPSPGITVQDLADAGIAGPTHAATCPVRVSDDCRAYAAGQGIAVSKYELADLPVFVNVLPDAGREVLLPPSLPTSNTAFACIQFLDLSQCTLATCASRPAVCALWGTAIPVRPNRAAPKCYRKNTDAGFGGCVKADDGGDPGELNVYPSTFLSGSCEPTPFPMSGETCWVYAGDRAEDQ
jgi:hypothetical protein